MEACSTRGSLLKESILILYTYTHAKRLIQLETVVTYDNDEIVSLSNYAYNGRGDRV